MPGVYIASKAKYGREWRALRESGYPVCSTWIDESDPGQTVCWEGLWTRVVAEIWAAEALIHILRTGDVPKGALVEVGVALAAEVPVYWVGERYQCCAHPGVTMCESLDVALWQARNG